MLQKYHFAILFFKFQSNLLLKTAFFLLNSAFPMAIIYFNFTRLNTISAKRYFHSSQKTQCTLITNSNQLKVFKDVTDVYCENYTIQSISSTLCWKDQVLFKF